MTMIQNHLEQISLSARSIAELEFPPPKIFTRALLGNHEITTLIRDTEAHERALFSLDPRTASVSSRSSRRNTTFIGSEGSSLGTRSLYVSSEPRKQSAVARVLGNDMVREIQRSSGNARSKNGVTGAVNVEILLHGAEKLCAIYPVPGAAEKIVALRNRHRNITQSIKHHEDKIAQQQVRLDRLNKSSDYGQDAFETERENATAHETAHQPATEQDLEAEEQEIRELEAKKRALQQRVSEMEKDLGGLLR